MLIVSSLASFLFLLITRNEYKLSPTFYSNSRTSAIVKTLTAIISAFLLIIPVILLYFLHVSSGVKVAIILIFMMAFSVALSTMTRAKRHEIFAYLYLGQRLSRPINNSEAAFTISPLRLQRYTVYSIGLILDIALSGRRKWIHYSYPTHQTPSPLQSPCQDKVKHV